MDAERRATVTIISNARCSVAFRYPTLEGKAADKERTRIVNLLDDALAIEQKGAHFNPAVQHGLWDGRRHMFYKDGCTFPKGIMSRLKKLLREAGYKVMKTKDERTNVHGPFDAIRIQPGMLSGIELRPDQIRVINAALEYGCGLMHCATGAGKTEIGSAIIKVLAEKRCLFLVHTKQLLKQARERIAMRLGTIEEHIGVIGDGRFEPKHITIATVQSLGRARGDAQKKIIAKYLKTIGLLILDECFPAGTMVGDKPIETIRVGDVVPSFDGERLVQQRVRRLFISKPQVMVRVQAGSLLTCTFGHPVLTQRGWVAAGLLCIGDAMLSTTHAHNHSSMSPVSEEGGASLRRTPALDAQPRQGERVQLLLRGTQEPVPLTHGISDDGSYKSQTCFCADEVEQPDETRRCTREVEEIAASDETQTSGSRRKWKTDASTSAAAVIGVVMANRGRREHQQSAERGLSTSLQDRHRITRSEGRDRGRREESLLVGEASTRSQEGGLLTWVRVGSVEVLEPTGDGTFGGVCPDGLVYNLEIEDTHTYVADGFVVHNCHHSSAKSFFKLVQRIDAPWRYGMSGTPFGLADGKGLMVEAAFGPVVERVTNEELIALGVNAKPTIRMIEVNEPKIDSGLDWQGVYKEGIVLNPHRNMLVADWAATFAGKKWPTLVLVRELWHGDNLCALLRDKQVPHAFVHGQMPTEEVERQKVRLTEGKICVLIASPIFGEGVDIPSVRALIVADGGQSAANVLQKVGRGLRRKALDNRLDVIDFADNTHKWLAKHSLERMALYQAEGFEVIT